LDEHQHGLSSWRSPCFFEEAIIHTVPFWLLLKMTAHGIHAVLRVMV